ncbi:aminodeoxychorismate/anthranilate synthase component II [Robertmurraya yapensis]|uniref:Aminodeoxychorismate/anthranilate synthase component II n=2 Tax=Bacillaceae TaxID=186817 RepID=A0A3S0RKZ7_9BACI|nr:aminodeoxychorismate/anthranilate synthase component II [Bacillus yapensis]RTR30988.1 aminodeoxychorismate/anthranilate synthase component II [Bacillus yapensis]TKS95417.1 aminodeoxychorismate/anthranilate synthase component II [Bacillus yapensis]
MILLIDNYDSFTFNLYQYLGELGEEIVVRRNDQITIEEISNLNPEAICLSPGPGRPEHAGICVEVIQSFYKRFPILGICLGHQAIGAAFGANVVKAKMIMHGKRSQMTHTGTDLFDQLSEPIEIMRYHSLVIEKGTLGNEFQVLGESKDDNEIMAIKHNSYPLYGLQFHPESVGTEIGKQLLGKFLEEIRKEKENESLSTAFI